MQTSKIKLILFDMDGTLLNSEKEMSSSVLAALKTAADAGIACCFGTGRSISELLPFQEALKYIRYGVCESGGLLHDFWEEKILQQNCIEPALAGQVLAVAEQEDIVLQVMSDGQCCMQTDCMLTLNEHYIDQYRATYEAIAYFSEDNMAFARSKIEHLEKINLYHTDTEARERTRARLCHLPLELVDSEITSLEISPKGVSKGTALHNLAQLLGIKPEECCAVGDADNDLTMLAEAGLAIAMGNANERVKAIADLIVADNDHDGIQEAVEACLRC